jgi:hypothetical protein
MLSNFAAYCGSLSFVGRVVMFSDLGIAMAYFTLPVIMVNVLGVKRDDILYPWLWTMFAMFIIACGLTHVIHAFQMPYTTFAHTDIEATVKFVTAVLSITTAVMFAYVLPRIKELPSPSQTRIELEQLVAARTKHKDNLLREINHRVGNQLQIMCSVLNLERRKSGVTAIELELINRIEKPLMELIDRHVLYSMQDYTGETDIHGNPIFVP